MKLSVKDLISVGLFSVIYFICFMISGSLGYIPTCVVILPFLTGLLGGIPFVLLALKQQKFGAVTLLGLIAGLLSFLMGQTWMSILFGLGFGLIADLIMKSGDFKSWTKNLIAYSVFSLWTIGTMLPMWIMRESYFEASLSNGATQSYIDAVMKLTPTYMIAVIAVLGLLGGFLGASLGKAVLKKHFRKAGIV